jgi:hypothetical protein
VFAVQYLLIFRLFAVYVSPDTAFWIMSIVFLTMAVVPSIALVEVGVRGEISLRLLGMFSANSLGIGLTSVTVWFMNLVFPAIIGSLLMLNLRIFARRQEGVRRRQPSSSSLNV